MKSTFTRREILWQAARALPALHIGLGSPALLRAWSNSPEQINGFQTVQLFANVNRLDDMRMFYKSVLSLPLVGEDDASLTFQAGRTKMTFRSDPTGGSPFYHFAFNIPENKLERAMEWLTGRAELLRGRRGNTIVHFTWLDAHSVFFYDPAGNLLEFIAHHPLKNGRPGKFDVEDILYTSEIGLVTNDVLSLSAELDTRLGLTNYAALHGLSVSDVFQPIGDPYGFFIVVKNRRIWLMTDDPAALYPVTAEIRGQTRGNLSLQNCDCNIVVG